LNRVEVEPVPEDVTLQQLSGFSSVLS